MTNHPYWPWCIIRRPITSIKKFLPRDLAMLARSWKSYFCSPLRPSVRLSVTRVLCDCDKTKQCTADILIPHERAITLVFWHQQWLVATPLPSEICAHRDPPPSKNANFISHKITVLVDASRSLSAIDELLVKYSNWLHLHSRRRL